MSTITIRPSGTVDLGYMTLIGALEWNAIEQELSVRGASGFADLLAGPRAGASPDTLQASAGCVLIEDWGSSRRLLNALADAGIIRVLRTHDLEEASYAEARVVTDEEDLSIESSAERPVTGGVLFLEPTTPKTL